MSTPYWLEKQERDDDLPPGSESIFSREVKIALGLLVICLGVLAWVVLKSGPGQGVESSVYEGMVDAYDDSFFDGGEYDPQPIVGPRSAPAGASSGHTVSAQDETNARWLLMELKRLVRAGQSMEELRHSDNLAFTRRCLDGMQKLQRESRQVMSKGISLDLPSDVPSISSVLNKIKVCISCGGDAKLACDSAERDLMLITSRVR